MRHAQSITDAAFQHMLGFIKPGMTEKQVRNELENFMFANGADSLGLRLHRGERSQHRQSACRPERPRDREGRFRSHGLRRGLL